MTVSVLFYPYHFIRTILSVPFCPYHFVRTILSVYHFVHTILSVSFCPLTFCPRTRLGGIKKFSSSSSIGYVMDCRGRKSMSFELSDSIKRGGASCCEKVYLGCDLEIILKDDTKYLKL